MSHQAPWVIVSAGFHWLGGQSKANAALADYLARSGYPVHLVSHEVDQSLSTLPNVTVHQVRRLARADFMGWLPLHLRGRSVARGLHREHPETRVVVNGGNCTWPDVNWVHYVHSAWKPSPGDAPWWFRAKDRLVGGINRFRERKALRQARLVITNSLQTLQHVLDRLALDPKRVHNLYLGTDPSWQPASPEEVSAARAWLRQPPDKLLAVFVGGLGHDRRKGFDTLWKAWQQLCQRPEWDVDLVVAGDGLAEACWRRIVAEAGLGERVRFLGHSHRIRELLAAADVLVSPIRYEPYGLNAQEAICRGVPVIVSAAAGIVEQLGPEVQPLVLQDAESSSELAERLLVWRRDPGAWRERFQPLSAQLRSRSWWDMAAEFVQLVEASANPKTDSPLSRHQHATESQPISQPA